jgi:hypothetical protein
MPSPPGTWTIILLGAPPPQNAAGGCIAVKPERAMANRDAWALGFEGQRTVGVWVRSPDGASVPGLIRRAAVAPISFDAFARMDRTIAPLPQRRRAQFWEWGRACQVRWCSFAPADHWCKMPPSGCGVPAAPRTSTAPAANCPMRCRSSAASLIGENRLVTRSSALRRQRAIEHLD